MVLIFKTWASHSTRKRKENKTWTRTKTTSENTCQKIITKHTFQYLIRYIQTALLAGTVTFWTALLDRLETELSFATSYFRISFKHFTKREINVNLANYVRWYGYVLLNEVVTFISQCQICTVTRYDSSCKARQNVKYTLQRYSKVL